MKKMVLLGVFTRYSQRETRWTTRQKYRTLTLMDTTGISKKRIYFDVVATSKVVVWSPLCVSVSGETLCKHVSFLISLPRPKKEGTPEFIARVLLPVRHKKRK